MGSHTLTVILGYILHIAVVLSDPLVGLERERGLDGPSRRQHQIGEEPLVHLRPESVSSASLPRNLLFLIVETYSTRFLNKVI